MKNPIGYVKMLFMLSLLFLSSVSFADSEFSEDAAEIEISRIVEERFNMQVKSVDYFTSFSPAPYLANVIHRLKGTGTIGKSVKIVLNSEFDTTLLCFITREGASDRYYLEWCSIYSEQVSPGNKEL